MKAPMLNARTLELIIKKEFDELTIEENKELVTLVNDDKNNKDFIESLIKDTEKLMDYISHYTKITVECDEEELESKKNEFLREISKRKRN